MKKKNNIDSTLENLENVARCMNESARDLFATIQIIKRNECVPSMILKEAAFRIRNNNARCRNLHRKEKRLWKKIVKQIKKSEKIES